MTALDKLAGTGTARSMFRANGMSMRCHALTGTSDEMRTYPSYVFPATLLFGSAAAKNSDIRTVRLPFGGTTSCAGVLGGPPGTICASNKETVAAVVPALTIAI